MGPYRPSHIIECRAGTNVFQTRHGVHQVNLARFHGNTLYVTGTRCQEPRTVTPEIDPAVGIPFNAFAERKHQQ